MVANHSKSEPHHNRDYFDGVTSEGFPKEKDCYFQPKSMIRKIDQEAVILLGGGRAILLQLAHPFVAAGVDDYSNFESEILKRLYRTLLFKHNLVFMDRDKAQKALQHFHAMHKRIRGRLRHRAGRFPANTPYSGTDPHAKLWVHATFVDTCLKTYERFIKPLSLEERQKYYSDTLVLARLMKIPEEILPQTLDEFQEYMKEMFSGDSLAITDTTRRLAHAVLYPNVGFFPSLSARLLRFVTAGLLPERFRREFGLKWGKKQQFFLNCLTRSTRSLRPFTPSWVWQTPLLEGKLTYFLLWGSKKSKGK